MKYKRYEGSALSRTNQEWTCQIWQEAESAYTAVGELDLEGITISWSEKAKHEPLQGSSCILQLDSPGDRTYVDLYTTDPTGVRLDVYRGSELYWSGCLDPEFYEEPYERARHYTVSLTFSDLGSLDRKPYAMTGAKTIREIVAEAQALCGASFSGSADFSLVSSSVSSVASPSTFADDLCVQSGNFFDEDGAPMTMKEALEAVLQPLGMRVIQKMGRLRVYDLNGLYANGEAREIEWFGDRQTLGTDSVYNNIKITLSTYVRKGSLKDTAFWPSSVETPSSTTSLNQVEGRAVGDSLIWSYGGDWEDYAEKYGSGIDRSEFTLWTRNGITTTGGDGLVIGASRFRIVPQGGSEEAEGVAARWLGAKLSVLAENEELMGAEFKQFGHSNVLFSVSASTPAHQVTTATTMAESNSAFIPKLDDTTLIKVTLPLLTDIRISPWTEAFELGKLTSNIAESWTPALPGNSNVKMADHVSACKKLGSFLYIPVRITLAGVDGKTYEYCNINYLRADDTNSYDYKRRHFVTALGSWREATSGTIPAFLAYYKPDTINGAASDDNDDGTPCGGWASNRHAVSAYSLKLDARFRNLDDGQYLPAPPVAGNLQVTVLDKFWVSKRKGQKWLDVDSFLYYKKKGIIYEVSTLFQVFNWVLLKAPTIEVVRNSSIDPELPSDDIIYEAECDPQAKEELSLDHKCGTALDIMPMSLALYAKAADSSQAQAITRAGKTSQAETLLCGTLYSQYAKRKAKITGESTLCDCGVKAYAEQNQEGKKFIMAAEEQDLLSASQQSTIIEIAPDEYQNV